MITLLDTFGPAVLRASWQAAALAIVVMLIVRLLGERISPRWRYRLWSVVVIRMLIVVVPASPWSAFNLVRLMPEENAPRILEHQPDPIIVFARQAEPETRDLPRAKQTQGDVEPATSSPAPPVTSPAISSPTSVAVTSESRQPLAAPRQAVPVMRIVTFVWLAGFLLFGLQLMRAALVLRRRLSVCRRVADATVLSVLEAARKQIGLLTPVDVLVTPESISPCIVGVFKPRIIVPEALVTESLTVTLRHVLAHELAHIARGDLWTHWLLLLARALHWFNPVAWWTIREMQAEREAACDDLALAASGENDRSAYASTIVELAASLAPSGIAPAMIGLISSNRLLTNRIKRLVRSSSVSSLRAPLAAGIMLAIALPGLTDAMPATNPTQTPAESAPVPPRNQERETKPVVLRGRCVDQIDKTPIVARAIVHLFKAQGKTAPIVEVAKVVTNREGLFEFPPVPPSRPDDPIDPLFYLVFAEAGDRPIGGLGLWNGRDGDIGSVEIGFLREKTTFAGTVQDTQGRPVAGATVAQWAIDGRPIPGILSATTGPDGRFLINRIPHYEWLRGGPNQGSLTFTVSHRGYPQREVQIGELPKNVTITLETGCRVTGTVIDGVTGQPAAGALVLAYRLDPQAERTTSTDAMGRFEMALEDGEYSFCARAKDRVGVALTDRECLAGGKVELPPFTLVKGGLISGQVVNTKTGKPIAMTERGEPIAIGFYGPSLPYGKLISPLRMTTTDGTGRYTLRAAPGENFPYLVNLHGDRMAWDTTKQPAIVVKEGETTSYNMLVTPKVSPEEKLKAAQNVVAALPVNPPERTARILDEFRKLNRTVDETELWCSLLRELVTIGPQAVPEVCAELDRSSDDRTLRRLSFALRAIGDARAIPALIRAIPKALLPSSSDYGLIVADAKLTEFMQKNDLKGSVRGGRYFDFGRPEREIFGALQKLTGQRFDDSELNGLGRSDDPHRQALQRRLFTRHARAWQAWWEAHWREFTDDTAYQKVNIAAEDEPIPAAPGALGPKAHTENHTSGAVLSPAAQEGQYTEYFYDLDTGARPAWPRNIPRDEAQFDLKQIAAWAERNGVDLMCVTHTAPDGTSTFVLRSFGMKAWEIDPRELRRFDRLIASGTLPKGHDAGELLMHFDHETKRAVPDANGAFVYVTREGSMGLIEITDRVTQTADLTGRPAGNAPAGVGFKTGVRFNLKSIVP